MSKNYEVEIVADSISEVGQRITTFVLTYPRFIHGELMTHRVFSRNAMSSRAVPVNKMIEHVESNTAMPIHWGKNKPGMQASEECNEAVTIDLNFLLDGLSYKIPREEAWNEGMKLAVAVADGFYQSGYHKQIVNRLIEPYQLMRTVVTATTFENWFWLRDHADAMPEIKWLAGLMNDEYKTSNPKTLHDTEWHMPFYNNGGVWSGHFETDNGIEVDRHGVSLENALKVSASCCAQASFRKADESIEKAIMIYEKLVGMEPAHFSPFEHQAKPVDYPYCNDITELKGIDGATHIDVDGNVWSGNFKGWIQHRQLLANDLGYKPMTVK
jgi:thymidylate synthase ThyX